MQKNTVKITQLLSIPNYTITAVASYRNYVFVSVYGDKLLVYTVSSDKGISTISEPKIYENYFGTKYAASEIIVDSVHELLLCLTPKGVYCVDINDFNAKTKLSSTEKCTCMALNVDCSRLCVGTRKKTLIFTSAKSGNGFYYTNFIPSKETPLCMDWLGNTLFVGCKIAYYIQDIDSCSITKTVITKCSKSKVANIAISSSSHSEALLLDTDNLIYMVDKQGMPSRKKEELIAITTEPYQLVALYPYLFVIVSNYLYVYNLASLTRIQKIPLGAYFHIVPMDKIATPSFLLYSNHTIYNLGLLSPDDQITILISQEPPQYEQAIAVAKNHGMTEEVIVQIHLHYGYYLFSQNLFDEAIIQFKESGCPPQKVLGLFMDLKIPTVSAIPVSENPYTLPTMSAVTKRRAYDALSSYLLTVRSICLSTTPSSSQDMYSSYNEDDNKQVLTLVDTSLVFIWIALQDADALKDFLLNKNWCDVVVVEEKLVECIQNAITDKAKLVFTFVLLYLFEGQQQYKRAVEVVLFQMQVYHQPCPERTQLLEILTHILYGLDASDESLVFKCSEKIYQEAPSLVINCFISDDGMISHLNIYHVIKHLQQLTATKETVYDRNKLALQYLSAVIPHIGTLPSIDMNKDSNLSQTLAIMYIETIQDLIERDSSDITTITELKQALQLLLETSSNYIPEPLLKEMKSDDFIEERCIILAKQHQHTEALSLIINKLHDIQRGYTYCNKVIKSPHTSDHDVYLTFLHILLHPDVDCTDEQKQLYTEEAYKLVDHQHENLVAEQVLEEFPEDTPLERLFPYIQQATTTLTETMYNKRMKYNLIMSDYLEVSQHIVAKTRQNGIKVSETSVCTKCGKPLGTSAIVWLSDSELYHYNCCEFEGDCVLVKDRRTGLVERKHVTEAKI